MLLSLLDVGRLESKILQIILLCCAKGDCLKSEVIKITRNHSLENSRLENLNFNLDQGFSLSQRLSCDK